MTGQLPKVSVVLVNFRGVDDTLAAVRHLGGLDYPADLIEVVVVDNASGDDSVSRLRHEASDIVLIESAVNGGFGAGCNLGVSRSSGSIVAFLNNDARPDRGWVRAAVAAFEEPAIAAVASRVLDWEGRLVDYVGAGLTWFGMGYKPLTGEKPPKDADDPRDVLFGTGSAMFVRRDDYLSLGGFDERYFMFFEDVDFGWRLNLRGRRFRYVPESIAYHRHHASMSGYGSFREDYLLERNALYTLYKNRDDAGLAESLPAALALAVARSVAKAGVDSEELDLRSASDQSPTQSVPRVLLAGTYAVDRFVAELPALESARREVQSTRVRSDRELWPLFGRTDVPAYDDDDYLESYEKVVTAFDVVEPPSPNNVLIITGDPIGRKMAGPAIRALQMALSLRGRVPVRIVSLSGVDPDFESGVEAFHVRPGDESGIEVHEKWADVIVFQGHAMAVFDVLRRTSKVLIVDIYDPMHLEQLEQARTLGQPEWDQAVASATEVLNEQLQRGDFFLAASERQRAFWLGQLAGLGRLNPAVYEHDPYLDRLVTVVPFGLPDDEPTHDLAVLKGVLPGISQTDRLVIWGGGLYDWFDPITLIRAIGVLQTRRPDVRLYFQGTKHPHPGVPEMPVVAQSRALAAELGLLDSSVFFNDSWVDYEARGNFLLEADVGVSTHRGHVETAFSFRTRILDYLWAGLPMVVTRGDHFGDLVEREELGVAVPPEDVEALADALEKVIYDDEFRSRAHEHIQRVRERYRWSVVLAPFVAFAIAPQPAADRIASGKASVRGIRHRRRKQTGLRHDVYLVVHYLRHGGISTVIRKARRRMTRRRSR